MQTPKKKQYPVRTTRVFLSVISWLPLWVLRVLGRCFAAVAWRLRVRAARTTIQNIEYCFPHLAQAKQRSLARRSLRHTACTIFEMPAVWRRSYQHLRPWIRSVHGEELFRNRLESGPLLLILPHFGNWEFLTTYLHPITKFSCLYSPRRLYELDQLINECRSRMGGEFLPVTQPGLRKLVERIRSGGVVIVLPDQVPHDGRAVSSRFMERPLKTGSLPHELLKRGNLKALAMVAVRCKHGFDIHIQDVDEDIYSADAVTATQALDRAIERIVEIDPAQYQWEYKRFRGAAEIYQ